MRVLKFLNSAAHRWTVRVGYMVMSSQIGCRKKEIALSHYQSLA